MPQAAFLVIRSRSILSTRVGEQITKSLLAGDTPGKEAVSVIALLLIFQNPPEICRNWHHTVHSLPDLVAEASQGRSLHLSR